MASLSSLSPDRCFADAPLAAQDVARGVTRLFFHATYVSPGWRGLKRVAQLGNHIFYR